MEQKRYSGDFVQLFFVYISGTHSRGRSFSLNFWYLFTDLAMLTRRKVGREELAHLKPPVLS